MQQEADKLITPGPGQYKTRPPSHHNPKKPLSIFSSRTDRFQDPNAKGKSKKKVPPLGHYDIVQHTIQYEVNKKVEKVNSNPYVNPKEVLVPFNSKKEWFEENVNENERYRGPGYYDVEKAYQAKTSSPKKEGVHQAFNSTKQRFGEKYNDVPGPGDYENTTQLKWFKKSYNMIFAE
jgi:hypothetical protein